MIRNAVLATTFLIVVPSARTISSSPVNPVPSLATAYTYATLYLSFPSLIEVGIPVTFSAYLISKSDILAVVPVVVRVNFSVANVCSFPSNVNDFWPDFKVTPSVEYLLVTFSPFASYTAIVPATVSL